ncbi:hypothetical protein FRC07_000009 [Ceratobasidium sp. 392]|nr:hypothetical protein FRC07_000009 [Ceratobasidium sp. 392]
MRLILINSLTVATLLGISLTRADDLQTVYERRLPFIVSGTNSSVGQVRGYMRTLRADGTWAAVDYTSGCSARRANWPASGHWSRILSMTVAYYGGVQSADQYVKSAELRTVIGRAMEFWFANDFSTIGDGACMDGGGVAGKSIILASVLSDEAKLISSSNVILIPRSVGQVCLLLRDELTPTEYGNCTLITSRAYTPFFRDPPPGYVSGANIIDMASVGVSAGLLENNRKGNTTRVMDAYQRVHDEITIHPEDRVDGIKPDGSFQQHAGVIYDGNYGKDFSNSIIELELQAADTQFQANGTTRDTFGRHIGGAQWMSFANTITNIVHWDMGSLPCLRGFSESDGYV